MTEEQITTICPNCGSSNTVKVGFRITVNDGKKQRLQCNNCGKTFYPVKLDELGDRKIGHG